MMVLDGEVLRSSGNNKDGGFKKGEFHWKMFLLLLLHVLVNAHCPRTATLLELLYFMTAIIYVDRFTLLTSLMSSFLPNYK